MPIITFEGPKLPKEKKAELVKQFTKTTEEIVAINPQHIVVIIKENDLDNVGSGGKLLSDIMKPA